MSHLFITGIFYFIIRIFSHPRVPIVTLLLSYLDQWVSPKPARVCPAHSTLEECGSGFRHVNQCAVPGREGHQCEFVTCTLPGELIFLPLTPDTGHLWPPLQEVCVSTCFKSTVRHKIHLVPKGLLPRRGRWRSTGKQSRLRNRHHHQITQGSVRIQFPDVTSALYIPGKSKLEDTNLCKTKQETYSLHSIFLFLFLCPALMPPSVPVETWVVQIQAGAGKPRAGQFARPTAGQTIFQNRQM